ncbi:MAG: DUF4202 family protein [Paludibaculum sp.]
MADGLDVDAMLQRFRDRAHAVRNRPLPPIAGEERTRFIEQAQLDFQDFAIVGDAEATLADGVLTLRVDLRPSRRRDGRGGAAVDGGRPPRRAGRQRRRPLRRGDRGDRCRQRRRPEPGRRARRRGAAAEGARPRRAGDGVGAGARSRGGGDPAARGAGPPPAPVDEPARRAPRGPGRLPPLARCPRKRHAAEVGALLHGVGYPDDVVERVSTIVRKEGLGRDPQVQVHEDALCLTFVELQLAELAARLAPDVVDNAVVKSLAKMSPDGVAAALALDLGPAAARRRAAGARPPGRSQHLDPPGGTWRPPGASRRHARRCARSPGQPDA